MKKYIHILFNKYLLDANKSEIFVSLQKPKEVLELWKGHHKWKDGDTYKDHLAYNSFDLKKILKDLSLKKLDDLTIKNAYRYFDKKFEDRTLGIICNKWFLVRCLKEALEDPKSDEAEVKHWKEITIQ